MGNPSLALAQWNVIVESMQLMDEMAQGRRLGFYFNERKYCEQYPSLSEIKIFD